MADEKITYDRGVADEQARQEEFRRIEQQREQELRKQRVATLRTQQANRSDLKPGSGSVQAEAAQLAQQADKRIWQGAQEAVEDLSLSLIDLFLITGPVAMIIYLTRWVGGNMMGGLIRRQVAPPPPFNALVPEVEIGLVPGYSLADPLDHVRHMKILLIGAATITIYGLFFVILYYITKPDQLIGLAWQGLIDLVNQFLSALGLKK